MKLQFCSTTSVTNDIWNWLAYLFADFIVRSFCFVLTYYHYSFEISMHRLGVLLTFTYIQKLFFTVHFIGYCCTISIRGSYWAIECQRMHLDHSCTNAILIIVAQRVPSVTSVSIVVTLVTLFLFLWDKPMKEPVRTCSLTIERE